MQFLLRVLTSLICFLHFFNAMINTLGIAFISGRNRRKDCHNNCNDTNGNDADNAKDDQQFNEGECLVTDEL